MNMPFDHLLKVSNARSRSISAENVYGEPGRGGMAVPGGEPQESVVRIGQEWGSSLKIMHADAEKRYDYTLQSMLRELRFLREEKLRVIRDEQKCLKRLKREKIQKHLQSIPGIGFRTGVILQAELWDLLRFKDKNALSSYTGLAPRLVGSGENEVIRSAGNRKKKELHYVLIEAAWRSVSYNVEMRARYGSLLHKGFKPQRAISIIAKRLLYTIRAV